MPNNFEKGAGDDQNADNPWVKTFKGLGSDADDVSANTGLKKHQLQGFGSGAETIDVYDSVEPTVTRQVPEFGSDPKMVNIVEPKKYFPNKEADIPFGTDENNGETSL
jgi:hypothetical protein